MAGGTDERATVEAGSGAAAASIDAREVERFGALADAWWDEAGEFKPLHKLNPVRLAYVRDAALRRFGRDAKALRPLDGLAILDIGCGGGLLTEPLARLGARVVGIDAAERNVEAARRHAAVNGLAIEYRATSAEALAAEGQRFDLVLNMEVVEHVADVDAFLAASLALVKPGGLMILATLNRTLQSYAFAIVGAEMVLRWLPRGTHDWNRFLRPSELAKALRAHGGRIAALTGVVYSPITGRFALGDDLAVNYMALVERA
ncbi:MAG TPA: bifunctional 2-polyprenyl-6-hydroxyphenol methylase/3-demethylubiquinol 3-O-methyltransferase UbiG [Alphaproteobacteria bacterium]|nr:bifunctional 2-polyprenyl-6-hydroxyphenol methylase/3-demethylubiquinol 3-O-methyltransferase UbiG [Alphaproteobacteria bacterium]